MKCVVISGGTTGEDYESCARRAAITGKYRTVKDLIEALSKFDPSSVIVCSSNDWWSFAAIEEVEETKHEI